jgi:hypothetical protein
MRCIGPLSSDRICVASIMGGYARIPMHGHREGSTFICSGGIWIPSRSAVCRNTVSRTEDCRLRYVIAGCQMASGPYANDFILVLHESMDQFVVVSSSFMGSSFSFAMICLGTRSIIRILLSWS